MPRIRVPIASVSDADGSQYLCFAEGHPRPSGEIDVRLAFVLKDESRSRRTPGIECTQPDEDGLAAWAARLTAEDLTRALERALASRQPDPEVTLRKRRPPRTQT